MVKKSKIRNKSTPKHPTYAELKAILAKATKAIRKKGA
jgi:hypothetical protein